MKSIEAEIPHNLLTQRKTENCSHYVENIPIRLLALLCSSRLSLIFCQGFSIFFLMNYCLITVMLHTFSPAITMDSNTFFCFISRPQNHIFMKITQKNVRIMISPFPLRKFIVFFLLVCSVRRLGGTFCSLKNDFIMKLLFCIKMQKFHHKWFNWNAKFPWNHLFLLKLANENYKAATTWSFTFFCNKFWINCKTNLAHEKFFGFYYVSRKLPFLHIKWS